MEKLDKANIEDILALTPMQEGMLFHYLKDPECDAYFEQLSLNISGEIDLKMFEKAWNFVIETNEMLRVVFRWEKVENPIQIVLKKHKIQPKYYDFSGTGQKEVKKRLEEVKVKDREETFDLREVPFRVTLCKIQEDKHEIIISNHHILYDGWSNGIILKEFFRAYNDLADAKRLDIPVKTKFREFVKWLNLRDTNEEECYWKEYLEGFDTKTGLLVRRKREKDTRSARNYQFSFGKDIKDKIESMVGENKITLAYVFYSAWSILLQKYNNNRDVVFGTTVSGRSARVKGIENVVGLFLNTLPLRIIRRESESVMELLRHVNQTLRKREEFERTALVDIKNYSEIDKKEELFDSVLVIENYPLDKVLIQETSRLSVNSYSMFGVTNYNITIRVEMKDDIKLNFIYNQELFNNKTVVKLSHGFRQIVTDIISNPAKKVSEIEILTEEEQRELLYDFNNTKLEYPGSRTIHQLFEKQARQTPTKIAVVSENKQLTYCELNQKSNLLAGLLIKKGVNIYSIIGIIVEPSLEMMVGMMGILKAGGAHLTIDPENTEGKINYMLKESNAEILLTQKHLPDKVKPGIMIMKLDDPGIYEGVSSISHNKSDSKNLVYVIYTSGTTGKPKGVLINHKNLLNYVYWFTNEADLTSKDKTVLTSSFAFDLGYTLIYSSILTGGELHLIPKEKYLDAENLLNYIKQNQVSYMKMTPSFLSVIVSEKLRELRLIVVGGEPIRIMDIGKLHHMCKHIKVMNHYGPTETTIGSVARFIDFAKFEEYSENPTIGKPINNIEVYILDHDFKLSPIGVPGELYLSGAGVARGYLCRPELTSIKFIENPFRRRKRMYRTGDLSRWHSDGNIEFLGRIDNQIKIRGYRIEPGEIESKLLEQESIKKALVLDWEDTKGIKFLAAYIVSDEKINPGEIKRFLVGELPGYMIPSHFVQIKEIPLTANGKVKRDALPKPHIKPEAGYVPPTTDIEKSIAQIWRELLGLEKVGVNKNFFDVGGNSLYIIRLNSRLKEAFNQDIPVVALFRYPTISAFAQYLTRAEIPQNSLSLPLNQVTTLTHSTSPGTGLSGHEAAVIGMSGRFPGAKNINEYWDNLIHGAESISYFSEKELETGGLDIELLRNSNYIKAKGIVEGVEYFDADFFNYTPVQAEIMDPQIRFFHECAWEALEEAGYNSESYKGLIGVYGGAANNFMWLVEIFSPGKNPAEQFELRYLNNKYFSTLISYRLKLKGPSISVNTACSTSLVAIDMAYWDLLNRKCDMALAGGVTITYPNKSGYLYQEGMIKSPDGHCRAFDEKSAGTLEGNGIGIVVLKRLEDAINDRDHIYAVIKGSATNNDGERKVGYTAPSIEGQVEVIRAALRMAGVKPETIGYIEAHGTGTSLGDPIEIEGLKLAFDTDKKNFCGIGSVKTNIGHLDEAAGAAGFIKTVLSLKHKLIPPSLHFETANLKIDLQNSPFYINTVPKEWKTSLYPRRAGVSSFGIGGSNAHVILEEAPAIRGQRTEARGQSQGRGGVSPPNRWRKHQLILLSAKTPSALDKMTENLEEYFKKNLLNRGNHGNPNNPDPILADAAYTLQVGRKVFKHRRMLVCSEINEAAAALSNPGSGKIRAFYDKEDIKTLVFMFPGLGSQYISMGWELYQKEPKFREEMDNCFEIMNTLVDYNIKEILYPGEMHNSSYGFNKSYIININHIDIAQIVIFIFEYALAKLIMKWGITPGAMIGYSFGEYVAACVSGVFSLKDALKLIVSRGKLLLEISPGRMLSVPLPQEELIPLLDKDLSIAVDNGLSCIVAGNKAAVEAFEKRMKKRRLLCMFLPNTRALHSQMMDPILNQFKNEIKKISLNKPGIPFISNVTGKWLTGEEATDPGYWLRQMRETVLFSRGISQLAKMDNPIFVEIGPGREVASLVRRLLDDNPGHQVINLVRHQQTDISDLYFLLNGIGKLWLHGVNIDWNEFYKDEKRYRISLPTYCFDAKPYWGDEKTFSFKYKDHPIQGNSSLSINTGIADWFYIPSWKRSILLPGNDTPPAKKNKWLIFIDGSRSASLLVNRLEQGGHDVISVTIGDSFARISGSVYSIAPQNPGTYETLFAELRASGKIPSKIVHWWNVEDREYNRLNLELINKLQELGFYSLINITKAIAKQQITGEIGINVVTGNIQEVTGEEILCPIKATVLGPVIVIPQEFHRINCRAIDVVMPPPGTPQEERLIDQLVEEFTTNSSDRVIAYRSNQRWVQIYEALHLDNEREKRAKLRENGVYLITGGLGNIGLVLAKYLTNCLKAKLILTGRTAFPAREKWEHWLSTHEKENIVSRRIKILQELENQGGEFLVFSADTANQEQMREVIAKAEERFGPINGVIHAAGLLGTQSIDIQENKIILGESSFIREIEPSQCEKQFQPKIYGLLVLENLLREKSLDFCWLMSSVSSVLGGLGFIAYSAANIFMDVFVKRYHALNRGNWISVNWDAMAPGETAKAFQRILSLNRINQVVVSNGGKLRTRIARWIKLESLKEKEKEQSDEPLVSSFHPRPNLMSSYEAPRNQVEQILVNIWRNVFGLKQIGTRDDFFELGGDSLKAITVIPKIQKELNVEIPLNEFFNNPTIEKIAKYINGAENKNYFSITSVEKKDYYPLSSAQQRMFILQHRELENTAYNIPEFLVLEGKLEKEKLENTFIELIKRHESMRTAFLFIKGEPLQRVYDDFEFGITYNETGEDEARKIADCVSFIRPFDLSEPPLLRIGLLKTGEFKHILMVDTHHIISDGVSYSILMRDFTALYNGETLVALRFSYKDFSEWQNRLIAAGEMKRQEEYWMNQFKENLPGLNLPLDYPRPAIRGSEGKTLWFKLDKEMTPGIKKLVSELETTLYIVLLAVYTILLSKYSGQEDIIVGSPVVGRTHADLENIIGIFANMLAMRNRPEGEKTFKEFLEEVKINAFNGYKNQDYQFEDLVWKLKLQLDPARSVLFDVVFTLRTVTMGQLKMNHLKIVPYDVDSKQKQYDLLLGCAEIDDAICMELEYSTLLFKEKTARGMLKHYVEILKQVIVNVNIKLKDIELSHDLLAAQIKDVKENEISFGF